MQTQLRVAIKGATRGEKGQRTAGDFSAAEGAKGIAKEIPIPDAKTALTKR